ncbi:hypothetical protein BDK51DRAFT_45761 [Blyttiomyces helicus]|uniref:Uncharacterized protein n=1 Tax=Blyttiomyces helicus TaxID=388810 RepID=A0A4P9WPH3_9FUNG|nr:hypothetical protein BDK51DRAFT_45761 [Blyttiomyces helicus]|eukprot:RKO92706.1 hypothetical protein BDK51DRAFT_45761 [Blyttiomyces helicus]
MKSSGEALLDSPKTSRVLALAITLYSRLPLVHLQNQRAGQLIELEMKIVKLKSQNEDLIEEVEQSNGSAIRVRSAKILWLGALAQLAVKEQRTLAHALRTALDDFESTQIPALEKSIAAGDGACEDRVSDLSRVSNVRDHLPISEADPVTPTIGNEESQHVQRRYIPADYASPLGRRFRNASWNSADGSAASMERDAGGPSKSRHPAPRPLTPIPEEQHQSFPPSSPTGIDVDSDSDGDREWEPVGRDGGRRKGKGKAKAKAKAKEQRKVYGRARTPSDDKADHLTSAVDEDDYQVAGPSRSSSRDDESAGALQRSRNDSSLVNLALNLCSSLAQSGRPARRGQPVAIADYPILTRFITSSTLVNCDKACLETFINLACVSIELGDLFTIPIEQPLTRATPYLRPMIAPALASTSPSRIPVSRARSSTPASPPDSVIADPAEDVLPEENEDEVERDEVEEAGDRERSPQAGRSALTPSPERRPEHQAGTPVPAAVSPELSSPAPAVPPRANARQRNRVRAAVGRGGGGNVPAPAPVPVPVPAPAAPVVVNENTPPAGWVPVARGGGRGGRARAGIRSPFADVTNLVWLEELQG